MSASDIYSSLNWFNGLIREHPEGLEDHVNWSMAGFGADFVGLMQPLAEQGGKLAQSTNVASAAATPIIQKGLLALMAMSNTCGFGDPDEGGKFAESSGAFQSASDSMDATKPPHSWQGTSSDAYGDRNDEQRRRASQMAEVDSEIKAAIADEAEQVDVTRKMLDRCQTSMGLAIPIAIALKFAGPTGPAKSLLFEMATVAAAMPPALVRYTDLIDNSARNATLIRRAGATYDRIAAETSTT